MNNNVLSIVVKYMNFTTCYNFMKTDKNNHDIVSPIFIQRLDSVDVSSDIDWCDKVMISWIVHKQKCKMEKLHPNEVMQSVMEGVSKYITVSRHTEEHKQIMDEMYNKYNRKSDIPPEFKLLCNVGVNILESINKKLQAKGAKLP